MATLNFSPTLRDILAGMFRQTAKDSRREAAVDSAPGRRRAERDVYQEMIWNCPEAFGSETGAGYMLHGFHGR